MFLNKQSIAAILLAAASMCAAVADTPGVRAYANKDYAAALRTLPAEAKGGNAQSQHHMGLLYFFGRGVEIDHVIAHKWFLAAAEQGLAKAQWNVGQDYEDGLGVTTDMAQALAW